MTPSTALDSELDGVSFPLSTCNWRPLPGENATRDVATPPHPRIAYMRSHGGWSDFPDCAAPALNVCTQIISSKVPSSMSVTTSTDSLRYAAHNYLADYELHHSDTRVSSALKPNSHPDPRLLDQPTSLRTDVEVAFRNPKTWPANHRRIPPYRPINKNLDQSQRRVYTSTGERMFLTVMFTGLQANVVGLPLFFRTGSEADQGMCYTGFGSTLEFDRRKSVRLVVSV